MHPHGSLTPGDGWGVVGGVDGVFHGDTSFECRVGGGLRGASRDDKESSDDAQEYCGGSEHGLLLSLGSYEGSGGGPEKPLAVCLVSLRVGCDHEGPVVVREKTSSVFRGAHRGGGNE